MNNGHKGFTLIELLVVIAIIGLLSTVVLAALNSARNKGYDSGIKADLASIRSAASLFVSNNGSYTGSDADGIQAGSSGDALTSAECLSTGTLFDASTGVGQIITSAYNKSDAATTLRVRCAIGTGAYDSYAVMIRLRGGGYWCIDSTGVSKQTANTTLPNTPPASGGGTTGYATCP